MRQKERVPGISGRTQLEVRARAGLGAHQAAAALDRRRRPRRDQPAVRTDRGAHRAEGGRTRRAHLVQRTYSEPHWDAPRGAVMAYERVTLYGLPLVAAPPRRLRAGRAGAGPRAVHPARAGRGRLADPPPLLPRQRPAARGTRGDRGARPPPRPASSATTRSTRSTTPASRPTSSRRGTSTRGGRSSGTRRRTC